ncbi:peptidoglycan recognition protein family protein [Streptomyces griseosporeus]|uniref:peptidoglycan recognition protein family protein n=1 Tax=Streptomyces griseosporeus TaxID=1910 RepID=UPI0036F813F2
MRGLLATSIGVTCAAALALPLTPPAAATPAASTRAAPAAKAPAEGAEAPAAHAPAAAPDAPDAPERAQRPDAPDLPDSPDLPGSTQSLRLTPLHQNRATNAPAAAEAGLARRDVRRFSLLGVVWDDPDTALHGRVQVRTRAAGTGTWSGWQDVETHNDDHGADPDTAERTSGHVRGATAPLWVGDSDGVEIRVRAEPDPADRTGRAAAGLPEGLRLELVDPGSADDGTTGGGTAGGGTTGGGTTDDGTTDDGTATGEVRHAPVDTPRTGPLDTPGEAAPAGLGAETRAASAANTGLTGVPLGATEIPALDQEQTQRELLTLPDADLTDSQRANPKIGPRPRIVTRHGWGADEKLREKTFVYTKKVKAAFVHHTATGNKYSCSQAPSVIRGIYRYHVKSMGWRDIGYNFLVDKCGTIYEGRAGGVAKPVLGAHTLGFNTNSMGIAVLGTFTSTKPSSATVKAIGSLTAWKLGLYGMDPRGKTYLTSGGGNLYRKGKKVRLNVISGHRDGFATDCPGTQLYGKLGSARSTAASLQGR